MKIEAVNSISKFICSLAALIAAVTFACLVYRVIDFDHHPLINIRHSYDHTIYMRPPGFNQPAQPQQQDTT
jgi:hypothetical protein